MIFVVMQPDHPIAIWELPTYSQYIYIHIYKIRNTQRRNINISDRLYSIEYVYLHSIVIIDISVLIHDFLKDITNIF